MRGSFMRSTAGPCLSFVPIPHSAVSRNRPPIVSNLHRRQGGSSHIFKCIVRDMQSLSFTPGRAFLSSDSPTVPWTVVFEDEGVAGYFYACDRSQEQHEHAIMDAMLIYNVAALLESDEEKERPEPQRIASVEWSRDGLQAVLYLDGTAQALYDFQARCGYCRMDFPNICESP